MALALSDRERRIALALAAIGLVIFVAIRQDALLALGWAGCAALATAAHTRRRVLTAFVSFVIAVFGPWGGFFILGALYLGLAFWLVAGRQVAHARRGPRR